MNRSAGTASQQQRVRARTDPPRYAHELNLSGLRSWPLTRYPYLVFYVEHPDHVDVWRVLQGQRDITAWMQEPGVA
jgi:toxin ParE1/3/4